MVFLFVMIWSVLHERQSHVRVPDVGRFEEALPSIANLTGSPILAGNSVQVLQNGDGFFPPLSSRTSRGRGRTSISRPTSGGRGRSASRSREALAGKARQGVEVRITLDATGSHRGTTSSST